MFIVILIRTFHHTSPCHMRCCVCYFTKTPNWPANDKDSLIQKTRITPNTLYVTTHLFTLRPAFVDHEGISRRLSGLSPKATKSEKGSVPKAKIRNNSSPKGNVKGGMGQN